jgi:hypothetical protein
MNEVQRKTTAEEVVAAILVEFERTTMPGYYVDYVRNWFRVYLSPDDFAQLKPFEDRVREEAARALDERLKELNNGARGGWGKITGRGKRCERLGDWRIEFHWSDEVGTGGLEVQSEGVAQAEPEPLEGAETVKRTPPGMGDSSGKTRKISERAESAREQKDSEVFATLEFEDDSGPHRFEMLKETVTIGRGGANTAVDIAIMGAKDISRLHCLIRRDAASGNFEIKDLSRFGTWVDGKRLPPSANVENGTERDLEIYVPLPAKANISLAEKLTVRFSAGKNTKRFWLF